MLRKNLIKNKSFKEFLMPSYIEYWRTLSYSTCQQYKSYKNIVRFRKNLFKHATKNGVTLINSPGDNDYQNFINNIIKPKARRAAEDNGIAFRAKRVRLPKIEIAQALVVVDNALEQWEERQTRANASASASVTQQPIAQALALVQEADFAPVPMVQLEQPMADAATVPMIQFGQPITQEQVPVQEADAVPVQEQAPIAFSTPIFNGTRKPLVLNGIAIEVDPNTFMVNATQMCRAAGKLFGNYRRLDSTEDYLQGLSSDIHICISELVTKNQGGRGTSQDTNVHFLVALHLAYWLSREVQVQFSKWIGELLLTGRVELGNEMKVQQLEDVWRRIVKEVEAKAAVNLDAERNRCQEIILQKNELEQRIVKMEEDQQRTDEEKKALIAIKAREDLETTIQALVKNTAPMITSYKDGDNVLYLARIDGTKFKYGHTKNLGQRFETHMRPGVYPTFEPVGIFSCNNGVASEDKLRDYVKKKKIIAEYGTQREVIALGTVNDMHRFIKKMQKCTTFQVSNQHANDNTDVVLRRIDAETSIELKRIELLMECKITFEQYLQMK